MPLTYDQFIDRLKATTGADEDSAGTLAGYWDRLRRKHVGWRFAQRKGVVSGPGLVISQRQAQTGSLSSTQPILQAPIYSCPTACTLVSAHFAPDVSYTISASDCVEFRIVAKKSATYSATFGLATLRSTSAAFTPNIAGARIAATLETTTPGNLNLPAGATIYHSAVKNAVAANGAAQALAGQWTLVFEEN